MSGPWGPESGRDDAGYIRRLRELLDDFPVRAVEQFSPNGVATTARCTKLKIVADKYLQVASSGVSVPIVLNQDQITSTNCYVDTDTGVITFGTAPAAGTNMLVVYKRSVVYSDTQMLQALYGGLNFLYPKRFREAQDTSISLQTNQWDYTLPDDFTIPDIFIKSVNIREIPASTNRFMPAVKWARINQTLRIVNSQAFTPGSTVEVAYTVPYRSLSDVDDIAADVPLYYAAGQLLGFKEAGRTRVDNQTSQAGASANPPGFSQQSAAWFLSRAKQIRDDIQRPIAWGRAKTTLEV
jgi:hypothetical protein